MENLVVSEIYNATPSYTENISEMQNIGKYERVKDILLTYIVPLIIITGLIGNTICFIVFVASSLKRISTSVYLAALAFSDTGFLVCLGIGWLESLGIRLFHKEGICQITVYSSFVFSFTSIWFVNAFTLEMYIAVFHPQKSSKLCLPRSARKFVGALSVVGGLMYIHAFVIAKVVKYPGTNTEVCLVMPKDEKTAMILSVIDTVLTLVVPFTMILFMITRLFVHISKFYKVELESSVNSTAGETNSGQSENQQNRSESATHPTIRQATEAQTKLTRMLVVTVVVFLVLNLPSHAIKVQFLFRSMLSENVQFTETEGFIQVIFQILYYANFSVNFLLYSACGRSFRSAMLRLSLNLRYGSCRKIFDCNRKIKKLGGLNKMATSDISHNEMEDVQQHSRLVDIHLNEIRFSQLPSIGSEFVCQSPPCLLAFESEQLLEEGPGK
ncbi:B1 bradykinin receptor-like [Mercenaria mercenaria]|uniref:B1 bradykinin receptor-like n=1 Tax=Mercenaria mercenaria TaxID=6596 RepID=UPI00234F8426|nr:B1 bradykinin receptor-like [Mercenaria mercenaria]